MGFTLTRGVEGAQIYSEGSSLSSCKIVKNGGGIDAEYGTVVSQCTISNNTNGGVGLGINAKITNCIISNNGGMGISLHDQNYINDDSSTIEHCTVASNKGYGIHVTWGANSTITDCEITNNSGPGIYAEGAIMLHSIVSAFVNINDSTITANTGVGIKLNGPSNSSITGCLIERNAGGVSAYGYRDPDYNWDVYGYANVSMNGCRLTANGSYGFQSTGYSKAYANACVIEGSTKGISIGDQGTLTNCLLTGNVTGAYVAYRAHGTFKMCTISANKYGIAVNPGRNAVLLSTICYGNDTELTRNVSATYSCVRGGAYGTGNIDSDPLFTAPDQGDYRLQTGSPCIDTGKGSITVDLLGFGRPVDIPGVGIEGNAAYDMGAYEVQPAIPYTPTPTATSTFTATPTGTPTPSATPTVNPRSDINSDGTIGIDDLMILQREWKTGTGK